MTVLVPGGTLALNTREVTALAWAQPADFGAWYYIQWGTPGFLGNEIASSSMTEDDVNNDGTRIVFRLYGDGVTGSSTPRDAEWVEGAEFTAARATFLNRFTSVAGDNDTPWNTEIQPNLLVSYVTRYSDDSVVIDIPSVFVTPAWADFGYTYFDEGDELVSDSGAALTKLIQPVGGGAERTTPKHTLQSALWTLSTVYLTRTITKHVYSFPLTIRASTMHREQSDPIWQKKDATVMGPGAYTGVMISVTSSPGNSGVVQIAAAWADYFERSVSSFIDLLWIEDNSGSDEIKLSPAGAVLEDRTGTTLYNSGYETSDNSSGYVQFQVVGGNLNIYPCVFDSTAWAGGTYSGNDVCDIVIRLDDL